MEQAVNSFLKGLLLDTHPMQLDTTSLSDALNATLITMDGNEVILLTDMGNASIENVHLPSGYVPVGMKEFGGVIYIASYNPLTNRSQIGSFPSPQLRFYSSRLSGEEDFPSFTLALFIEGNPLKFKFRSMMIPLDDNQLIRAGDKFQLYSSNLDSIQLYISNWNNIIETEGGVKLIKSPKNNYLTLSVGVLNSRNEFVDITKTLVRFDDGGNRLTFDNISEDVIFNSGYFIVTKNSYDPSKNKDDLNTYAYKLVGPLYLKIDLNLPVDFDYSIEGYKSGENEYKLTVNTTIKYNCPDGIPDPKYNIKSVKYNSSGGLKEYVQTDETVIHNNTVYTKYKNSKIIYPLYYNGTNFFATDQFIDIDVTDIQYYSQEDLLNWYLDKSLPEEFFDIVFTSDDAVISADSEGYSIEKNTYDKINNLFSVNISKDYTVTSSKSTIDYTIVPTIKFPKWNNSEYGLTPIEISDLQQEGELELFKLGTGEMELTAWRFYNDLENQKTSLAYSFDAYPKPGHEFKDLLFDFYKVVGDVLIDGLNLDNHFIGGTIYVGTHISENTIGYNGNFDEIIDWKNLGEGLLGLEEQEMYQVVIRWKDYDRNTSEIPEYHDFRWLLTTELFNNSYSTFDKRYIKDFCNPEDIIERENYNKLVTLDPYLTGEYDNLKLTLKEDLVGQLFTLDSTIQEDDKLEWGYNTEYNASSDVKVKLGWNSLNYPKYLSVSEPLIYLTDYKIEIIDKNIDWNKSTTWENVLPDGKTQEIIENEMISYESVDSEYLVRPQYGEFNYTSSIKINLKDFLFSLYEEKSAYAKYKFESFKTYIINCQNNKGDTSDNPYYFSIGPAMRNHSGRGTLLFVFLSYDGHYVDPSVLNPQEISLLNKPDTTVFGSNSTSAAVYSNYKYTLWDDSAKRGDMSLSVNSSLFLDAINDLLSNLYPLNDGIFLIEGDFPREGGENIGLRYFRTIWARTKTGKATFGWVQVYTSPLMPGELIKTLDEILENFKYIYGCFSQDSLSIVVKTLKFDKLIYNTLYNTLINLINTFTFKSLSNGGL